MLLNFTGYTRRCLPIFQPDMQQGLQLQQHWLLPSLFRRRDSQLFLRLPGRLQVPAGPCQLTGWQKGVAPLHRLLLRQGAFPGQQPDVGCRPLVAGAWQASNCWFFTAGLPTVKGCVGLLPLKL